MFINETFVKNRINIAVAILVLNFASTANADQGRGGSSGSAPSGSTQSANDKEYQGKTWEKYCGPNATKENKTYWSLKKCEALQRSIIGSTSSAEDCKTKEKDFINAQRAFLSACASAPGRGAVGSVSKCVDKSHSCQCTYKVPPSGMKEYCRDLSANYEDEAGSSAGESKTTGINLPLLRKKLYFCPGVSGTDPDRFERKADQAQKDADRFREKIPDLKNAVNKADNDANEKIKEARKEARTNSDEYLKKLQETDQKFKEEKNQIKQKVNNIMAQNLQLNEQIGTFELQLQDEDSKKAEAKTQVDLMCNNEASIFISKLRDTALAKLAAGEYNWGGQNQMFLRAGQSEDAYWQKRADTYYKKCKNSKRALSSYQSANRVYDMAFRKLTKAKENARIQMQRNDDLIRQLQDPQGSCAGQTQKQDGSTTGNEMCEANMQHFQDQNQAYQAYLLKHTDLQQEIMDAAKQGEANKALAQANLQEAQNQQDNAQRKADNANAAAELSVSSGGADKDAHKEFAKTFADLDLKTEDVDRNCCEPNDMQLSESRCQEIQKAMDGLHHNSVSDQPAHQPSSPIQTSEGTTNGSRRPTNHNGGSQTTNPSRATDRENRGDTHQ